MRTNTLKVVFSVMSPLFVAGLVYLAGFPGSEMLFMSGRVAARHSYIEGECGKCHVPWKGVSNTSCTKCHVDDMHYKVKNTEHAVTVGLRCFDCHQEHRGRTHNIETAGYFFPL